MTAKDKYAKKAIEPKESPGQRTSEDLDRVKEKVTEKESRDESKTAEDKAKTVAEREKDIPKQPGHLDTRRPHPQHPDEKT